MKRSRVGGRGTGATGNDERGGVERVNEAGCSCMVGQEREGRKGEGEGWGEAAM